MKRIAIVLLLLACLSGAATSSELELCLRYADRIGLSESQQETVRRIAMELQKIAIMKEAEMRIARIELEELVVGDRPNLAKIESELKRIAALEVALRFEKIKAASQVRAVLEEEQRGVVEQVKRRLETQERQRHENMEELARQNRPLRQEVERLMAENRRLHQAMNAREGQEGRPAAPAGAKP